MNGVSPQPIRDGSVPVRLPLGLGLTTQDKFDAVMDVVVLPAVLVATLVWFWRKR